MSDAGTRVAGEDVRYALLNQWCVMADSAKILVIDHEKSVLDAIRQRLVSDGYQITTAVNTQDGLSELQRCKPDLVVIEIMLDGPTEGLHLVYRMKRDAVYQNVPVIVLSSVQRNTGIDLSGEIGTDYLPADLFLEKPVDLETLSRAARDLLADKQRHDA